MSTTPAGEHLRMKGKWRMRCRRPDGSLRWDRRWENLITNEGLNLILNTFFGSTAKASLFLGLKATGAPAAGDTMASHAGWTEITAYDEATRQTATFGAAAAQAIDNSGAVAEFTINANATEIFGAFCATNSTKGDTTGTLLSAGNFGSSETADDGDTLEITLEYSLDDDGI